jgi:hypothetical protein
MGYVDTTTRVNHDRREIRRRRRLLFRCWHREQVTEENLAMGLIYPPQSEILEASLHVAQRVATYILDHGLAGVPRPDGVGALIPARAYHPAYGE